MNYYPYAGNPSTDKMGVPGMYGASMPAMAAYQAQQSLPPGQSAMPPTAQHYATLGTSPSYPASSIYATSMGSNPYGSVSAMSPAAANAYVQQQQRQAGAQSASAHPGYTTNPYAAMQQGMSPAYSTMMPASTTYPGTAYSSSMLGYPTAAAHAQQIRSPTAGAYQSVGGYPAGLANPSIPAYAATSAQHPGLVRAAPGYPGTSPYSRLP